MNYDDLFNPLILLESDTKTDFRDLIDDVVGMEYHDVIKGMDKCVLMVRNPDMKYANDARLRQGLRFKLKFGYFANLSEPRTLIVTGAHPTFPQDGMSMISLTAYDAGRALAHGGQAKNYGRVTSSEVAKKIAVRYGLNYHIENSQDERRQSRVQPASITDFEYLDKLADKINFDFYVRGDTLFFIPQDTKSPPSDTFVWYRDHGSVLRSFEVDIKAAKPPASTHANTNSSGTQAQHGRTDQKEPLSSSTLGNRRVHLDPGTESHVPAGSAQGVSVPTAETNRRNQQLHAQSKQTKVEMGAVTATATLIGQPHLRARSIIQIDVVDKLYGGLWRIKEATHKIDASSGYTTHLKLDRNAVNAGDGSRVSRNQQNNANHTQTQTVVVQGRGIRTETGIESTISRSRARTAADASK